MPVILCRPRCFDHRTLDNSTIAMPPQRTRVSSRPLPRSDEPVIPMRPSGFKNFYISKVSLLSSKPTPVTIPIPSLLAPVGTMSPKSKLQSLRRARTVTVSPTLRPTDVKIRSTDGNAPYRRVCDRSALPRTHKSFIDWSAVNVVFLISALIEQFSPSLNNIK